MIILESDNLLILIACFQPEKDWSNNKRLDFIEF